MALISPKKVAQNYGITTNELARWRRVGTGPEHYRIAPRVIRYGTDDLDKWFADPTNAHLHHFPVDEGTLLTSGITNEQDSRR